MELNHVPFGGLAAEKPRPALEALAQQCVLLASPGAIEAAERTAQVFKVAADDQVLGPALGAGQRAAPVELDGRGDVGTGKVVDELHG
jgi:hypothetical protein